MLFNIDFIFSYIYNKTYKEKERVSKMKSEKGMSCIMMLLCVIIIIGFIWGIIYFTQMKYKEEKLETLKTDLLTIQGKVRILSQEVTIKKEGINYIGKKLSDNLEDESIKKLISENVITSEDGQYSEYYILEGEEFDNIGLEIFDIQRVIVNYNTCEIIYPEGFILDEKQYYKLSDFKDNNDKENVESNEHMNNIVEEKVEINEEE